MTRSLDTDQLRTLVAVAESGSFTRAAERVGRTQSAVSMQIKRLEEIVGRSLLDREGRETTPTPDGEQLLEYARRMLRLESEALSTFLEPEMSGLVRLGTPDDYAEHFLPPVLVRFAESNPNIDVEVTCRGSEELLARFDRGDLDLTLFTADGTATRGEVVRREPLVWGTSPHHLVHELDPVPLALSHKGCTWRLSAINALDKAGKDYRICYTSPSFAANHAAVMAGLAVGTYHASSVTDALRVLTEEDGFPPLPEFDIAMLKKPRASRAVEALADHVKTSFARHGFADIEAA